MFASLILLAAFLAGQAPPVTQPADADATAGQRPAMTSAADELKAEVRGLVRQLDSDELRRRDAAEQALIEKGPAVVDLLPSPAERVSAEVRQRLDRIRQKLQQAAVEAAVKPSLITLRADRMPVSKILAAIAGQSGNAITDYRRQFGQPEDDAAAKITFDKTPFWQALDQLLDQAGLTVYPYADEPGLSIVARPPGVPPRAAAAVYSGPLRFEPVRLDAQRDLREPKSSVLRLTIEAAWEPRLKPIAFAQRLADIDATDDRAQPLQVQSEEAALEVPVEGQKSAVELVLPFALPPREAKQIARVKGKLTAMIPGRIEEFSFGDLLKAKNVEKRQAAATVTLEQVRQNNEAWEIFVRVRFDRPGDALASHRGWIFRNEAYLESPDGKHIAYDTLETTLQTQNEVGVSYIFVLEKPPADLKFIYKTPGAILTSSFDYELTNLKLP
jgi:hypothetical protein